MTIDPETLVTLTADITAAHVSNNTVAAEEVPGIIIAVHGALASLGQPAPASKPTPAIDPRKSVKPDRIISLIDGKPYKMLKRHLALHGYTPESYREAFGLPHDYPMTARAYSDRRRDLAKAIGLGRKPGQKRGRKAKAIAA